MGKYAVDCHHTCIHPPTNPPAHVTGQLGDSLQRLAAQRTGSLKPAHKWVPWVVVNGTPLLEDDENVSLTQTGNTIISCSNYRVKRERVCTVLKL